MGSEILPTEYGMFLEHASIVLGPSSFAYRQLRPDDDRSPTSDDRDRFRELVEGVKYSREFVLTYQIVLVGLLLVFTALHWGGRLRAWSRRRPYARSSSYRDRSSTKNDETKTSGESFSEIGYGSNSSSSSTLAVVGIPESVDSRTLGERDPLLLKSRPISNSNLWYSFCSNVKALLVFQPRPVPILNKTLPSNGTSFVVLGFIGLQVFYVFYNCSLSISTLFVFADRTSIVFVANLPLLYLLAAKNQPIKLLTGYSYESLNIFHRRLGEVMCVLALLHSAGMVGVWYTDLQPIGITLTRFLLIKMIILGIGAFIAYELLYVTSLASFRQRWYELFLGLHVILQAAALALVWFHHRRSRWYVGLALAIFLTDRLVFRLLFKSSTLRASLLLQEDKETVSLRTKICSAATRDHSFGAIYRGWRATEHIFLTVPSLAHKHVIQAHPFTIASKEPCKGDDEMSLDLIIRAQDGFSGDLVRYAAGHKEVVIRIDGPYGSQSAAELIQDCDNAIIVAGGSGIAVAWPLLWSAIEASSGEQDLEVPFPSERRKKVFFMWVVREQSHVSWLGKEKLDDLRRRGVTVYIPEPTLEHGHPDIKATIQDYVHATKGQCSRRERIGVVASGPDGLNRAVRNVCASLIWKGADVSVEIEKFGW